APAPGHALDGPGPWEPRASPRARGSRLSDASPTARLPGVRAGGHRAHRTPPASGTGTPGAGQHLAPHPRGRDPPGVAGCPDQVVVAIARALVACMRAIAREIPLPAETLHAAGSCTERGNRLNPLIGRGAAPVWCTPRGREAAARNPRAETEAGARRTQVRWYPIHGYQREQPSCLTGSGSSADARKWRKTM